MNLLIVDDDLHVIRGIQKNIQWDRLGVTCVYEALGALEAKRRFLQAEIDVLICDIEMPQENGLDLLQWIRDKSFDAQAVFLTSYANFEYAQRAIKLGSLEYILKPVDYGQLETAICNAVERAARRKQSERIKENNRENMIRYFWNDLIGANGILGEEALNCKILENGMESIRDMLFLPIEIQRIGKENDQLIKMTDIFCENYFTANRSPTLCHEITISYSSDVILIMLKAKMQEMSEDTNRATEHFLEALTAWKKNQRETLICGVGQWSTLELVRDDVKAIQTMIYESPRNIERVLFRQQYKPVGELYDSPKWQEWAELLKYGRCVEMEQTVQRYLDGLENQGMLSSKNLQQIGLDITQMIYSYLSSINIQAHLLFDDAKNNYYYSRAALSSGHMMEYLKYLLSKSMEYKQFVERPQSIIGTVKDYIEEHYQENITREDLSRLVFLNKDYLSRFFKKETGMSISTCLINKRIELAKELLADTRIPVSVISAKVGYDNFAYFTKVFKEKTGLSPNEFRKNRQRFKPYEN